MRVTKRALWGYSDDSVKKVMLFMETEFLKIDDTPEWRTMLRSRLFGWDKHEVHRYLRRTLVLQRKALEEMEGGLNVYKEEFDRQLAHIQDQFEEYRSKYDELLERYRQLAEAEAARNDPMPTRPDPQAEDGEKSSPAMLESNELLRSPPNVIQLKPKQISQERAVSPGAITADGLEFRESEEWQQPIAAAQTAAAVDTKEPPSVGSSFWGNVDSYLQGMTGSVPLAEPVGAPVFKPVPVPPEKPAGNPDKFVLPENLNVKEAAPKESAALSGEIAAIRRRYIVGKRAGEDLYAESGRLIATKDAVITAEMVEAADHSGKLADLIVHMIVPGLEDDR